MLREFPKNFYWGAATSSHQVEGGTSNDWTIWEKSPERLAQLKKEGRDPKVFISGDACDHYNRYREDFDIAQRLGHNMHRFSVEWSRIEPREGEFDESAIQHYKDVVRALKGRGMEPMVTLWHFTTPSWLAVKGGVLNGRFPELYKRFISRTVDNLKGEVRYWVTFNEATTVYAGLSYLQGYWPPQEKSILHWARYRRQIREAHVLAYREIKNKYRRWPPESQDDHFSVASHNVRGQVFVGAVENTRCWVMHPLLEKAGVGTLLYYLFGFWLWRTTLPYQDFLGLNYYTTGRLPGSYKALPLQPKADFKDWEIHPNGLYSILKRLKRFKKPIFVTENGIDDAPDKNREKFIQGHLGALWRAIDEGVDVQGYLYWSLLDNFEWAEGFKPRFGLVCIDYATQQRTIRPSAWFYAKIIKDNGLKVESP